MTHSPPPPLFLFSPALKNTNKNNPLINPVVGASTKRDRKKKSDAGKEKIGMENFF